MSWELGARTGPRAKWSRGALAATTAVKRDEGVASPVISVFPPFRASVIRFGVLQLSTLTFQLLGQILIS